MKPFPWLSVLAIAISVFGVLFLRNDLRSHEKLLAALEERVERIPLSAVPSAAGTSAGDVGREELLAIEERLESLERAEARPITASSMKQPRAPTAGESEASTDTREATPEEEDELDQWIARIGASKIDWSSPDELERFFEMVGDGERLTGRVEALEAALEANPDDLELRMRLADTFIAKLMTVQGPEQSLWGAKASEQWEEIAARDEDHWDARHRLGNNLAYYPDVMGKTNDAIAYLEEAREIQLRGAAAPEHAPTVIALARLYQRKGDTERARELLSGALADLGSSASLEEALASLE